MCSGAPKSCDDGNTCTDDTCAVAVGCQHGNNSAPCTDSNPCTVGDVCAGGACKSGVVLSCDDGNPCTKDTCKPSGCVYTPDNGAQCSDGNLCTTADSCQGGFCQGTTKSCDDANVCTDDSCVPATGCKYTANAETCSDSNACTSGDVCAAKSCQPGAPVDCDDSNVCTTDSCAPLTGCKTTPANGLSCDDTNECTVADTCSGGFCVGQQKSCFDGEECTVDTCDPQTGCIYPPLTGPGCDDESACTASDSCAAGICTGDPVDCDDTNTCSADSCADATGCAHQMSQDCCGNGVKESGELCDDGNQQSGDGCSGDCQSLETCGNGILDPGEACDGDQFPIVCYDGAFTCSPDCSILDTSGCNAWCGDGKIDAPQEQCDTDAFPIECHDGAFTCVACVWDKSTCNAYCGDGIANGPDQCDGADVPDCPIEACSCSANCKTGWLSIPDDQPWNTGDMDGTGDQPLTTPDPACTDPSTLCLDAATTALSHAWIANSASAEVVKVNVDTGAVEVKVDSGGYWPSRTAVDVSNGSVWVGNRGSTDPSAFDDPCNWNGDCSNVMHFAADGAFICRADVPGIVRAVAIDKDGFVWAGSWLNREMYKISPTVVDKTQIPHRCTIESVVDVVGRPYGAVGDSAGNIWIVNNDNWLSNFEPTAQSLQQIDAATATVVGTYQPPPSLAGCYQNYGMALDGQGRVVIGSEACFGVFRFTPGPNSWEWRHIPEGTPRGVVVGSTGHLYTALSCALPNCWGPSSLRHIARVDPDFQGHDVIDLGPGVVYPVGASMDHKGRFWTTGRFSHTAARVEVLDWDTGPQVDTFTTDGLDPYTYSDMTGLQFQMFVHPEGTWTKVLDAGTSSLTWQLLAWSGKEEPGVTDIAGRARSATSVAGLPAAQWTPYSTTSPMLLNGLAVHGRYLEVQIRLTSTDGVKTPVLDSLTAHWLPTD